ncbi:MAG: hypothetical protein ILP10_07820 [Lachnospiraceae bacterium]|nr:hypothetical protein [Lachnospiraceae bacterium]
MRHYFIDLENVRSAGLEGVLSLSENDRVYVFYSDNANTLTIPTLESISSSKANVRYIKINFYGSNAMDFQIVAMFGAMIEREKTGSFFIISHDNGFKSAVNFCKDFFEDLDITLGWYPRILDTLDESEIRALRSNDSREEAKQNLVKVKMPVKKAAKSSAKKSRDAAPGKDKADEPAAKAAEAKPSRSRRKKKNADVQPAAEAGTAASKSEGKAKPIAEQGAAKNETKAEDAVEEKKGLFAKRRSRRRKASGAEGEQPANDEASKQERKDASKGAPDLGYVYKALSEYLSTKTIDLYAQSIHEGLLKSRDKKALKDFFDKKYQGREGEALYTIVQGEFDKLKAEAKKA